MSRITVNTKCRLCRTEGTKLYLKGARCLSPKCPIEKKGAVPPGMHGLKRKRKPSDFAIQLRAKQKAKRTYVVAERQFKNYYLKAKKMTGQVGNNLIILLETRLDNLVYQAGLANSRSQAKQFISHNHILVNDQPVNISSYTIKPEDKVSLDSDIAKQFKDELKITDKDFKAPTWIRLDKSSFSCQVIALPDPQKVQTDTDLNLIVEYYSR